MITRIFALALALTISLPTYANPQSAADAAARQHYERGKQLVASKDFTHAYDEFSAGYELTHRSAFLFNMGECERALGDASRARVLYDHYLTASPDGELAATARARLAELGGAQLPAPSPAPAPQPPLPPAVKTTPPPVRTAVVIPPPSIVAETIEAQPHPSLDVHVESRPLWRHTSFWVVVGLTVLAGSVAIYEVAHHHGGEPCIPPMCVMVQ